MKKYQAQQKEIRSGSANNKHNYCHMKVPLYFFSILPADTSAINHITIFFNAPAFESK